MATTQAQCWSLDLLPGSLLGLILAYARPNHKTPGLGADADLANDAVAKTERRVVAAEQTTEDSGRRQSSLQAEEPREPPAKHTYLNQLLSQLGRRSSAAVTSSGNQPAFSSSPAPLTADLACTDALAATR